MQPEHQSKDGLGAGLARPGAAFRSLLRRLSGGVLERSDVASSATLKPRVCSGWRGVLVGLVAWACMGEVAWAHVGNPNVVFEGRAGVYPVRVMIRPPGVVPGLAEIHVRVLTNSVQRVSVLPVHWRTGLQGAPPPDVAEPVPGEPNLYGARLWLMTSGSYSVHVVVEGGAGKGQVLVPVNSVATQQLAMGRGFGSLMGGLGLFLLVLALSILGAAIRESVLEPGSTPSRSRIWGGRLIMGLGAVLLVTAVGAGHRWWDKVDENYRTRVLYRPTQILPALRQDKDQGQPRLRLELASPGLGRIERTALVPDHGKLMHLYLIRETDLDAMAHLHPLRRGETEFETFLPPLPAGPYSIYADITHETGFSQTLVKHHFEIPGGSEERADGAGFRPADADDSWHRDGPGNPGEAIQPLPGGFTMHREDSGPWIAGRDITLRFGVRDTAGQPALLRPYLGMFSHAIIRARQGNLFMHLHSAGTVSLAAQQVMALRVQAKDAAIVTAETLEPFCKDPPQEEGLRALEFPCLIPEPGRYRIWVQCRPGERVVTGVFDFEIKP